MSQKQRSGSNIGAPPPTDPKASARAARLRYMTDSKPGIVRKKWGRGFRYLNPDGSPVEDDATRERIEALAIPPAYTDVWISPHANGHLQATGIDDRGRKQYLYHARWQEIRDAVKFHRMVAFGSILPRLRKTVDEDLHQKGLPREKVLATVVRLLDATAIRVGNEEYARKNHSFGLTTLHNDHVAVRGSKIAFHFRGKSGKEHEIELRDREVARVVRQCQELPGQELFAYRDNEGDEHDVDSGDVNTYLHEIAGEEFTAKDFRTWAGTVFCLEGLLCPVAEPGLSETQRKRRIREAVKQVAERLGNTPAVCRKSYIHPSLIAAYENDTLATSLKKARKGRPLSGLSDMESLTLRFLRGLPAPGIVKNR
ncbi:MAG: DNA topoisomerase IB [Armatimonadaceae bacterium]